MILIRNDDDFDTSSGAPLVWLHSSGYLNIVLPLTGISDYNYEEFSSDYIQIKRWNTFVISSVQEDFTVRFKKIYNCQDYYLLLRLI